MNSPHLEKQAMRQTFRQRRAGLNSDVKDKADAEIAEHIGKLLIKSPNRRIAAYLASPQEVDLQPWFEIAWAAVESLHLKDPLKELGTFLRGRTLHHSPCMYRSAVRVTWYT